MCPELASGREAREDVHEPETHVSSPIQTKKSYFLIPVSWFQTTTFELTILKTSSLVSILSFLKQVLLPDSYFLVPDTNLQINHFPKPHFSSLVSRFFLKVYKQKSSSSYNKELLKYYKYKTYFTKVNSSII